MNRKEIVRNILSPALLVSILVVGGCSSGRGISEYSRVLTNETVKANTTGLKIKVPAGWYTSVDNENNYSDLWILKDDRSETMNFTRLNIDGAAIKEAGGDELEAALKYSREFKKISLGKDYGETGSAEMADYGNTKCAIYIYKNKYGAPIRTAVFKYGNQFYELTAAPAPGNGAKLFNAEELYFIQDAVLASVE